ncbi:AsmA family protein [Pantoea sp. 1.19]|uniref:AsmA family protein n=1 Tax=Pantoea sp. 1.19 TaxID=1925589 RepID=UPI0009490F0D|nr:AsmA family protein [Pantoea sp. 1.19]
MKRAGTLLLTLLLLLACVTIAAWIAAQTRWGADWIGRTLSEERGWQISLGRLKHDLSSPSHLILTQVRITHAGSPPLLEAEKVTVGLSLRQFFHPRHLSSLLLERGSLRLNATAPALPIAADRLQLREMAIEDPARALPVSARQVSGGLIPWQPRAGDPLGEQAAFQFSAGALTLNGMAGRDVLIEGHYDRQGLTIANLGADLARGSLSGNGRRDAAGNWHISNLRLNHLRLQSERTLTDFLYPLLQQPSLRIDRLSLTDSRLQGPDWAVTDLNLALANMTLRQGDWQSDDGSLSLSASSLIYGGLALNDPLAELSFSPQGIDIRALSTRFANGLLRTEGRWTREDHQLALNELVVAGLEYTLPADWRQRWQAPLPGWLHSVIVNKLTANHNLIIDITPEWPWQITTLDGSGRALQLVRQQQWGIWQGTLSLNAAAATFNRVDVRHPSLTLQADDQQIALRELSAFTGRGLLEASGTIEQLPARSTVLTLSGKAVPVNVLQNWGWPPLPLPGDANLALTLRANLAAGAPLAPSVRGELTVTTESRTLQQRMVGGKVVP